MNDPNEVYAPEPTDFHRQDGLTRLLCVSETFASFVEETQPELNFPFWLYAEHGGLPMRSRTESDDALVDRWTIFMDGIIEAFREWAAGNGILEQAAEKVLADEIAENRDAAAEYAVESREDAEDMALR